jgi:Protein of unknown function (DUF2950)
MTKLKLTGLACRFLLCAGLLFYAGADPGFALAIEQKSFPTAEAAAQALLSAVRSDDVATLLLLLGDEGKGIVNSGDPVEDRNRRKMFVDLADRAMKVQPDAVIPNHVEIVIGPDDFPFPIPIVKGVNGWTFDTHGGIRELLARRIGGNENSAIALCREYVEAQFQFASQVRDGSGVRQYAQRFISSPGKHDGLYWPAAPGSNPSPIEELVTQAAAEGYDTSGEKPVPYHGYYFRILTGEGPQNQGGGTGYLVHGLMIGGFSLLAWPVEYGVSGIKSFLVNQSGRVYERDLGVKTAALAKTIKTFNPNSTWKEVQ